MLLPAYQQGDEASNDINGAIKRAIYLVLIIARSQNTFFFIRSVQGAAQMAASFPPNVHVSKHPCLRAKLSQLRHESTNARETKQLVHDIATVVACEALAHGLQAVETGTVSLPHSYLSQLRLTNACRYR